MAEPLKEIFNAAAVEWLAGRLASAWADFPVARFKQAVLGDLPALELKARIERIAREMQRQLPPDFKKSVKVVTKALGAPPPEGDGTNFGDFKVLACHRFVSLAGLDHADLALEYFSRTTRHFSAEFDIRPFIQRDQARTLGVMRQWADDDDWRLRRLACEGARPRLPWGLRLAGLVADPKPLFPILEALRDDPIDAVRRSVANNLNDIAKDHPDLMVRYVKPWMKSGARAPLIRHALRHLVKQGHEGALGLMGVDHTADLRVDKLVLDSDRVSISESIGIDLVITNAGPEPAYVIVDYAVHHLGARGEARPKVFKWTSLTLAPGEKMTLKRRHSLKPVTTRRYHPGAHFIDVRINGRALAKQGFQLLSPPDSGKKPESGTFSGRYRR